MRRIIIVFLAAVFGLSISGCAVLVIGGAAGAGGGYVYKQEKDKQDAPWPDK